ncbi:MAG: hypothetical protein IT371_03590 [Deltaproteobacteria bacterium]|nr:hypothetical protein [Deltaproteobacteria bacterium]
MNNRTIIYGPQVAKGGEPEDACTEILPLGLCPPPFPEAFASAYEGLRHLTAQAGVPGLAVAAVDGTGLVATAYLKVKRDTVTSVVLGRHSQADILLGADPSLSLRHLLAVLLPRPEGGDLRFRLMDLRTGIGFLDEHGRKMQALEAEGPMFVSCGRYALFLLTSDSFGGLWPDDAAEAWSCLPERIYFGEQEAGARPVAPVGRGAPRRNVRTPVGGVPLSSSRNSTFITPIEPPVEAFENLVADGEEPAGRLRFLSPGQRGELVLGASVLRRGLLFGRYERCDGRGLFHADYTVSRVHLLLLELAGALYALDTASTNGVTHLGKPQRIVRLDFGTAIVLGTHGSVFEWGPVN